MNNIKCLGLWYKVNSNVPRDIVEYHCNHIPFFVYVIKMRYNNAGCSLIFALDSAWGTLAKQVYDNFMSLL